MQATTHAPAQTLVLDFDFTERAAKANADAWFANKAIHDAAIVLTVPRIDNLHTHVRPDAHDTEVDAAKHALRNTTQVQSDVLAALTALTVTNGGATDEELMDWCVAHYPHWPTGSSTRSRRADLVEKKMVVETPERRQIRSGRMAKVWATVTGKGAN